MILTLILLWADGKPFSKVLNSFPEIRMDSELRQLQLKCLEIFDIVDRICREHHINYSLCGGSVVGAHLYKGILPWDDDIDIMMTRENYNKFLKVAEQSLPNGFSIINYQNSDYTTKLKICFTKIVNDNTTVIHYDGNILGAFVDIDVYDKVPEGFLKNIDLFLCKRIMTIDKDRTPSNGLKDKLKNFAIDTILSNRRLYLMFFQKVVEILSHVSTQYTYRELFGGYHYYNMIPYQASIFENYTTIEFENRKAMIVRDYIEYLKTRYNRTDFHEPKEKQVPLHIKFIDLNTPYKNYM